MADEHVVYVKIFVVGDSLLNTGFVYSYWQVEADRLRGTVANLAKYVCDYLDLGGVALSKMQLFVAKSEGDSEPTADEELAALSTQRLRVTQQCNTIKSGSFLLAVVDKLRTQGKHQCPRPPSPRYLRPFTQLSLPRLLQRATSGPCPMLGIFMSKFVAGFATCLCGGEGHAVGKCSSRPPAIVPAPPSLRLARSLFSFCAPGCTPLSNARRSNVVV